MRFLFQKNIAKKGDSMPRKKETLPDNFRIMMEKGDFEELKSLYETHEITATTKGGSSPFYTYTPCSEFYKWLVEQGADINISEYEGTPLHYQARCYYNNVEGLILAGADIEAVTDTCKETPLHIAVGAAQPSSTEALVKYGANVNALNYAKLTPLGKLFYYRLKPSDAVRLDKVITAMLNAGAKIEDGMKEKIQTLGEDYERSKNDIYTDDLQPYEQAMAHLYKLFDLQPPSVHIHDGVSTITVSSEDWVEQHEELWNYLVPSRGKCKTVQGEVVRIGGRIYDEIVNNGGVNWDRDYRKMLNALKKYYSLGNLPDKEELEEAYNLIKSINRNSDSDKISRLCEIDVHWVLLNPEPIALKEVNYER